MLYLEREAGVNNLTQTFTLEGVEVEINTYWNPRSGWYINVVDSDGNDMVKGKKIKPNIDLAKTFNKTGEYFGGSIFVVDNEWTWDQLEFPTVAEPLGYDNFGSDRRYQMVYLSASEMEVQA